MALANISYTATAGQTIFALTFSLLRNAHLVVTIDTVPTSAFTISGTNMVLDVGASAGEVVKLQRVTPNTEGGLLVDFAKGSGISEADLDSAQRQQLFYAQELEDRIEVLEP